VNELIRNTQAAIVVIGLKKAGSSPEWLGTGFLIGDGCTVLTCFHVVKDTKTLLENKSAGVEIKCFLFWHTVQSCRLFELPVKKINVLGAGDLAATYYGSKNIDVAAIEVDPSDFKKLTLSLDAPTLNLDEKITCDVGDDVIVVGFPSPHSLIALESEAPNMLEPLVQFGRISGILPSTYAPLPHLLALDMLCTPGSSGSPVVRVKDGKVIGMVNQMLLNHIKSKVEEEVTSDSSLLKKLTYAIPSGITYACPSNLFAGYLSKDEERSKFPVITRWHSFNDPRVFKDRIQ
jgi:S1-C subfamily serine protease